MKNKKGISLIVLIITIVVIIILAAAIIITLDDNDPIDAADRAVAANDIAVLKEAVGVANAQYRLSDKSITKDKYILDYLKRNDLSIPEGYAIENGKLVTSDNSGDLDEPTNLAFVANVGDYVDYPVSYSNATIEGKTETKTGWRVISRSGSSIFITTAGVPSSVLLSGLDGYSNYSNLLSSNMSTYVNSTYATTARSIKLEDISNMVELDYGRGTLETKVPTTLELYDLIILKVSYWFNNYENETGSKYIDYSSASGYLRRSVSSL